MLAMQLCPSAARTVEEEKAQMRQAVVVQRTQLDPKRAEQLLHAEDGIEVFDEFDEFEEFPETALHTQLGQR